MIGSWALSSLMIGALVSGLRDLGSKPGWVKVLCTGEKHYIQTVPLSSQEYEWVLANCEGRLK